MSSVTQDDDHQSSDVLLSIWQCEKVYSRGVKGNEEKWYYGFCVNEYNRCKPTKELIHLNRSGDHSIDRCRVEVLPKYQCQLK